MKLNVKEMANVKIGHVIRGRGLGLQGSGLNNVGLQGSKMEKLGL